MSRVDTIDFTPSHEKRAHRLGGQVTNPNVEVRVYARFSEVRLRVQSDAGPLTLPFSRQAWGAVREASVTLLGLPYTSRTVTPQDSWLAAFEGRSVWVRQPEGTEEVTLVRADDLLVRRGDGAFYRALPERLMLPDAPPRHGQEGSVTLTFDLPEAGDGVVSYVTDALTWTANYVLDLGANGEATLTAHASLHNQSPEPYEPDVLHLIAGEVREAGRRPSYASSIAANVSHAFRDAPSWDTDDDGPQLAGLYRYELRSPPLFPGRSTVTVPFENVTVRSAVQKAVLAQRVYAWARAGQGVFERQCVLTIDQPLLGATVTLRDQGYLVGERQIQETAAGQEIIFHLGREPNMTYRRQVEKVHVIQLPPGARKPSRSDKPENWVRVTHRVSYTLRNAGRRDMPFEITEHGEEVVGVRGDATCAGNVLRMEGTLKAGEERVVQFEIDTEEKTTSES